MEYWGQFTDRYQKTITVSININDGVNTTVEIGQDGLFFAGDPVTITRDLDDSFQHVIIHQAEITLQTENYIGDNLLTIDNDNIEITIYEGENILPDGSNVLFFGYAEPLVFSQPYVTRLDEFTITATDRLGQLKYRNYKGVYTQEEYDNYMGDSGYKSARSILMDCMEAISVQPKHIFYDGSIGLDSGSTKTVFTDTMFNDQIVLGDDAESVMNSLDTLEALLQYLNLHIMCVGDNMYIYNLENIRNRYTGKWVDILPAEQLEYTLPTPSNITFGTQMHADADVNLTMDDIYTQISARADMKDFDAIIESPLDNDLLNTSMFPKQIYMTEYRSFGTGDSAFDAFTAMLAEQPTDYDAADKIDWYAQFAYNKNWKTYVIDSNNIRTDITALARQQYQHGKYVNQDNLWRTLYNNPCSCGIFRFGNIKKKMGRVMDNAPIHKLEMTPYMCISLRGNMNHDPATHQPNEDKLLAASPIAEYTGNNNNTGTFSASDPNVTNYLVFSGKFMLQKQQKESKQYASIYPFDKSIWKGFVVPCKESDNGQGMYYTRRWWHQYSEDFDPETTLSYSFHPPRDYVVEREGGNYTMPSITPGQDMRQWSADKTQWREGGDLDYRYKWTGPGNNNDNYYKLPLLECELIIGNYRLIETNWGRQEEQIATVQPVYEWVRLGEEPTTTYTDMQGNVQTVVLKTFSLGIDPKIDDCIVGHEWEMANNVDYRWNIDASGTAIPIPGGTDLSGDVTFRILGPINNIWRDADQHTSSWWLGWAHHSTTYTETLYYVLSQCETMFIKDFSCKLYTPETDNGNNGGKEIIYMSAEDSRLEKKDDITFTFITQPDLETFAANNMQYRQCRNAVTKADGSMVETLYLKPETRADKAEKLYVNALYDEYHTGKLLLQGTFHMYEKDNWRDTFYLPSLDKTFYLQKISHSLKHDEAEVTFKEL